MPEMLLHSSKHHPSRQSQDITRLLDPSYSSSSTSSSSSSPPTTVAYLDTHGDLHDPDYRDFPITLSTNKSRSKAGGARNARHRQCSPSSMMAIRPRWELGIDGDGERDREEDEDEDALYNLDQDDERRAWYTNPKRSSTLSTDYSYSYATSRVSPPTPSSPSSSRYHNYHPTYTSPFDATFDDDEYEDEELEVQDPYASKKAKKRKPSSSSAHSGISFSVLLKRSNSKHTKRISRASTLPTPPPPPPPIIVINDTDADADVAPRQGISTSLPHQSERNHFSLSATPRSSTPTPTTPRAPYAYAYQSLFDPMRPATTRRSASRSSVPRRGLGIVTPTVEGEETDRPASAPPVYVSYGYGERRRTSRTFHDDDETRMHMRNKNAYENDDEAVYDDYTADADERLAASRPTAPPAPTAVVMTPTCTQALRREWQAVSLRFRFGLFRAKKRLRLRLGLA